MNLFDIENRSLYIVCFVPRSGSNHLCSMLEKHGLGTPAEFYYPYDLKDRYEYWQKRLPKYFSRTAKTKEEDYFNCIIGIQQGIAGIKASWESLNVIQQVVGGTLNNLNPKFIYVTRNDKIRQAISWAISLTTDIWSSDDLIGKPKPKPKPKPKFSRTKVDECLNFIKENEANFERFFQSRQCFRISYEEFTDENIVKIAKYLEVPINYRRLQVMDDYTKMNDDINDEWYKQYVGS